MSWDLFVQDIPASATSVTEIPDDFRPSSIGKRADIIVQIQEVVPTADFTSPDWGVIDGPGYSIEVSMGKVEDVHGFALHVRGNDQMVFVVADILEHLGLRAFDPTSDSGIFGLDQEQAAGLRRWRAYRNEVIGGPS